MIAQHLNHRLAGSVRRIGRRVVIDRIRFDAALLGIEPDPNVSPRFATFAQLAEVHPAFTESALRQLIARAEREVREATDEAADYSCNKI